MAKTQTRFVCQQCGRVSASYMGKCPQCGTFNSMVEEVVHEEPVAKIPSHRFLAIRRGEEQGVLRAKVAVDDIYQVAVTLKRR